MQFFKAYDFEGTELGWILILIQAWKDLAKDGTRPYVRGCVEPEELRMNLTSGKPDCWMAVFRQMIKWGTLCAGVQVVQG